MNYFQDMIQVLGAVRDEFSLTSTKPSNNLDYSFITPTLLALGKLNDVNVDELLHVIQGQSVLFWNLSGKSLGSNIPEKLNRQVIDNPWVTPGHFTQAPSLECVFRQCYSIKAWLDLKDDHIAVLHCGNGRYRTGILMACYLKYIGAFDKSAEAFDFFCGARLKKDAIPTLSPSYRILFENVDRSTDYGGSPNPFPLHLRSLSISGLPVDEIPCVEVWDMSGLVFTSHRGSNYNTDHCSWAAEYGDGFYRVGMDIIGDFSVMCRFGGSHALTRDKTTLIFKYQNSTAFLPPDVVELSKQNVDLNPEYADSLEDAVFSMHLVFDLVEESSLSKAEFREFADSYQLRGKEAFEAGLDEISKHHSVVPDNHKFQQMSEMKFPAEYIPVALQLGNNDLSLATSFMAVLLSRSQALKGVKSPRPALPASPYHVKLEKKSLGVRRSGDKARASMQNLQIEDLKIKLFDEKAETRSRGHDTHRGSDRDRDRGKEKGASKTSSRRGERPSRSRTSSHESAPLSSSDAVSIDKPLGDPQVHAPQPSRRGARSPPPHHSHSHSDPALGNYDVHVPATGQASFSSFTPPLESPPAVAAAPAQQAPQSDCGLCSSSDFGLRDQLVPCTKCSQTFHTKCFGGKRIPFSIKSIKERTNRDRYISKYFSDWVCPNCSDAKLSSSSTFSSSANPQESSMSAGSSPDYRGGGAGSGGGAGGGEKAERSLTSKLFGNFLGYARSHSRGVLSSSASAGLESQDHGDTVNPLFVPSGKVGYKQAGSPNPPKATKTLTQSPTVREGEEGPAADQKHEDFDKLMSLLASCGVSVEELLSMSEDKQKETFLAVTTSLKTVGSSPSVTESSLPAATDPSPSSSPRSPAATATATVSNPSPAAAAVSVETKTKGEAPSSPPQAAPAPAVASPSLQVTLTAELLQQWAKVDQRFAKYAKMFQVGLPIKTIEERLRADGIDLSQVAPPIPGTAADSVSPSPATGASETKPASPEEASPLPPATPTPPFPVPATPEPVPAQDQAISENDPRFLKYFQMMKLGLPKLAVAHKMCTDGVVPSSDVAISILDHKPVTEKELLTYAESKPTDGNGTESSESGPQVPFIEHPEYGKFFRMLKAGIPAAAVKNKMTQEGFDPNLLDNQPTDLAPVDLPKKSGAEAEELVACKDHPVYSKYFKMLKVGLPVANVKAKMEQEGYDPTILDKAPTDMVPVEIKGAEDPGPGEMVPLQDHPAYGKYLRMLKVGLPLVAAKQKMVDDGFDPSVLDKKPADLVPLDTNYRAPEPKVALKRLPTKSPAAKIRKKKLHWKALDKSRVGADSLWAADEDDESFDLDPEEFEQLFVQKEQKGAAKPVLSEPKKKAVVLVDPKRAQNAGIALARVKLPFVEVRERILEMDEKAFSADQYTSLMEYLPTPEEVSVLKGYRGDTEQLGPAERYMLVMTECRDAQKRIKCILFRQQFRARKEELVNAIRRLEGVCDDVKMSIKLKKVLKAVLKVGNQLNDGEDHMGFTVDSLLKLQSQKAFDKKTSILQYVVRLIARNDEACLLFPEDLVHLTESERLSIDQIVSEMSQLSSSHQACKAIVKEIADKEGRGKIKSMDDFLTQVDQQLEDISVSIDVIRTKYQSVLAYFGEEASLPSHEFFFTLEKFVKAFIEERELNERLVKAEKKKSEAEEKKTAAQDRQRRLTQVTGELEPASKTIALQGQGQGQGQSPGQQGQPHNATPVDRRRVGPNGAMVARRNSSYM